MSLFDKGRCVVPSEQSANDKEQSVSRNAENRETAPLKDQIRDRKTSKKHAWSLRSTPHQDVLHYTTVFSKVEKTRFDIFCCSKVSECGPPSWNRTLNLQKNWMENRDGVMGRNQISRYQILYNLCTATPFSVIASWIKSSTLQTDEVPHQNKNMKLVSGERWTNKEGQISVKYTTIQTVF